MSKTLYNTMIENKILTIAIPTYNRPDKVCARIRDLLPQIERGVVIHVVDNCSDLIIKDIVISEFGEAALEEVIFTRNSANIGLAGNISRCFEVSESEWLWLLGDDDQVEPDAIRGILDTVSNSKLGNKDFSGFNFSTGIHQYKETEQQSTLDEFWTVLRHPPAFSNALFLSSCVFRLSVYKKYMRFAYLQIGSYAPHIAVMMCSVRDGSIWGTVAHKVVKWEPAPAKEQWSTFYVAAGLGLLADVPGCSTSVMENLGPGLALTLWRPFLVGGLGLILCSEERSPRYWVMLLSKLAIFLHGKDKLKAYFLLCVARLCLFFPVLRSLGASLFRRSGLKSLDVAVGIDRL